MANLEDDPAADFLAREQDELAGLDDDGFQGETGGNNIGEFETAEPQPVEVNGPAEGYAAIAQVDKVRQEPEKIKKWREEQKDRLAKKDAEDEKKRTDWRDQAKKELDEWYARQAEQLEKTKTNNRASEKVFIEERDTDIPGEEWERIARLCDFNPKTSRHQKDVSRLRSIILQLKQQPPKTSQ
ncbi:PREDICTED: clathrin light chain B-like isoform X2 [Priapulus caudatus]|uniref:Clathrin light chain n=1 Tax=Priapulus caudatus TaxID=37621 RepID=A0ABM1DYQ4_PRICU|nr:PREDICTED: clathrin light chain B-like isoform X2 [Priapulus caudatus]